MPEDIQEKIQSYKRMIEADKSIQSLPVKVIRSEYSTKFGMEGYDYSFVNVVVTNKDGRSKKIRMFSKSINPEFVDENFGIVSPEEVLKRHYRLKKLGFPVPNTLRISEDNRHILMTDMTYNGQFEIIDRHNHEGMIKINNLSEIQDEVFKIAQKGVENGFIFSPDAFAILVDKHTSIGQVTILDIGSGIYSQGKLNSMHYQNTKITFDDFLKQTSENSAKTFNFYLDSKL